MMDDEVMLYRAIDMTSSQHRYRVIAPSRYRLLSVFAVCTRLSHHHHRINALSRPRTVAPWRYRHRIIGNLLSHHRRRSY